MMSFYVNEINKNGNIAVDDTILVKRTPSTAGSKMLENFKPLFSAEAVERLEASGYSVKGKTHVGEFGLDLLGETSYFKGETAAAARAVASSDVKAALCVDLNGAPRRAAAVTDTCFVKPTYGTVSRYGIIACACSGEQIGVAAKTVAEAKEVLSVIAGHDKKDGTSLPSESYDYSVSFDNVKGMKIALVKELYDAANEDVKAKIDSYKKALEKGGAVVEEMSLQVINEVQTAWTILMSAETTNNLSRFDGVKYGYRTENYKNIDELYVKSRTEALGFLTKATVIYGSDVLSKGKYDNCYDKALRMRRAAVEKLKEVFAKYDAALMPACSSFDLSYKGDAFMKVFEESKFTCLASITGMPAVVSKGVQLMGDHMTDKKLLKIVEIMEKEEA